MNIRKPYDAEEKQLLLLEENHFLDLKSKDIKPSKLQTHFVAFANSDGGEIYVGVKDRKAMSERIDGYKSIEEANSIIKVLLEETSPSVENVEMEFIDFAVKGFVLKIVIPKSPKVHYTSEGKCYIRLNASTIDIRGEKITRLLFSKGLFSYETVLVENTNIDEIVSSTYLKDYLKSIESPLEPMEFLVKQKLIQKKNDGWYPIVSCILLFCDDPQAALNTKCSIKVCRLNTCEEEYRREYLIEDPKTFGGPLEVQINRALECIDNFLKKYPYRRGDKFSKFKYPTKALKEILVNSVIHRDYSLNDDIHVRIYNDRIEIKNPGGFAGYITEENYLRERFARNSKIVGLLNKLPEKINHDMGEGLITAIDEIKKAGLTEPIIKGNENSVLVVIKHQVTDLLDEYALNNLKSIDSKNYTNVNPFNKDRAVRGKYYNYSLMHVNVNAFLPTYPNIKGSCLISFARLSDCMITFGHDEILRSLFNGLYTDISFDLRGFIVGKDIKDDNVYYVQLGNNRIPIFKEELVELCTIIDDFSHEYLKALKNIETSLRTYSFERSKYRENGFRLISIERDLWKIIIEFIKEHDYEKGDTPWHIFDASDGMIKVYSKQSDIRYNRGYHVMLYPEPVDYQVYGSFKDPDNEMFIVWEPMQNYSKPSTLDDFSMKQFWDAQLTYEWLVNELIPYVIYFYTTKRKKSLLSYHSKSSFDNFLKGFNVNNYIRRGVVRKKIEITNITTVDNLLKLSEEMQAFFNGKGTGSIYLNCDEISSLYKAVYLCLQNTRLDHYEYIIGNLSFSRGNKLEDILNSIDDYVKSLKDGVYSCFSIDTALRCIVVPLRDYISRLTNEQVSAITSYLTPIYAKQLHIEDIERFRDDKSTFM